jgi:hypothetical protein
LWFVVICDLLLLKYSDITLLLQELLTRHKISCAEFLELNYDKVFSHYQRLLNSENYVTRRQSLKLLGELLLDRHNFTVSSKLFVLCNWMWHKSILCLFSVDVCTCMYPGQCYILWNLCYKNVCPAHAPWLTKQVNKQTKKKSTIEIHCIYSDNKEICCNCKTWCLIIWFIFHNMLFSFVFLCSHRNRISHKPCAEI